ncbi:hypothetical protein V8E55_006437 [Tylopilus felleus]
MLSRQLGRGHSRLPHSIQDPRTATPLIGIPSANGTVRIPKSSIISQFMTPVPTKGSPLAQQGFTVPKSKKNVRISKATQIQDDPLDSEQEEFEVEDACLILEVARARHVVCQLEHDLAEAKGAENLALCDLYKHRAKKAGKILAGAEYDVGCVRNLICNSNIGNHVLDVPSQPKHHRMFPSDLSSSPTTIALDGPQNYTVVNGNSEYAVKNG